MINNQALKNMKLFQALKQKNRLVSEIKELSALLISHNRTSVVAKTSEVNIDDTIEKLNAKIWELIELKHAINIANQPIQKDIYILSEHKAFLKALKLVPTATVDVSDGRWGASKADTSEYNVQMTYDQKQALIEVTVASIGTLQDRLDEFNFTTEI